MNGFSEIGTHQLARDTLCRAKECDGINHRALFWAMISFCVFAVSGPSALFLFSVNLPQSFIIAGAISFPALWQWVGALRACRKYTKEMNERADELNRRVA